MTAYINAALYIALLAALFGLPTLVLLRLFRRLGR